jgi:hypothetical protein
MEAMMHPSGDLLNTPELDYEGWRNALRPDWGWYNPKAIKSQYCPVNLRGMGQKANSGEAFRVTSGVSDLNRK